MELVATKDEIAEGKFLTFALNKEVFKKLILQKAAEIATIQIVEDRKQYTKNIIGKLKKDGITDVHPNRDYAGINGGIPLPATFVQEVSNAINKKGINQVATAVQQMDQITQQNAASAEEQAAASEELTSQAQLMQDQVMKLTEQVVGLNGNGALHKHQVGATGNTSIARSRGALGDTVKSTRRLTGLTQGISDEASVHVAGRTSQVHRKNGKNAALHKSDREAMFPM